MFELPSHISARVMTRRFAAGLTTLAAAILLVACEKEAATDAQAPATASVTVGTTRSYEWHMEGTPAGETIIVTTGDGRVTNDSFVHWNNREYDLNSELRLDADGMVVAQKITGTSPFGATIDESFTYADGMAKWRTVGEGGSIETAEPAFYVPAEMGAVDSAALLVRAAATRLDGEVALFPSGTARVEKVTQTAVATPEGPVELSLYAVSGIRFTPLYVWMNAAMELAAVDFGGYLGMVPAGWGAEALEKLSAVQSEEDARYIQRLAGALAHRLEMPLVIENVDVVDVEGGRLIEDRHVAIRDGRIEQISATPIEATEAVRVDGSGRTLMPGLWDMHGHFSLSDGILNIAGGITSVRDIGGVHEKVMELTRKFDSGEIIGPHTHRAGFIDKAGPYASGWAAETLEDALQRVDFFADHGYIQIKLYSSIEPGWVRPIAERAHSRGLRVSGHIPAFMSAEQAVEAGYDEIQHINMVFLNFLAGDREDTRQQIRFTLYGEKAGELDLSSPEVEGFIALLKENDVVVDPTAAIFDTMLRHMPGEPDTTFAPIIEHLPNAVRRPMFNPQMDEAAQNPEVWEKSAVAQAAMLQKLYESGIQIVPGSDNLAAFTVHRELELYVDAGIPQAAVLRMATLDSARVTGVEDRTGSVTVGKVADLLLLDGNPLEDISAIRRAALVVKGDTVYRPDELYRAVGVTPFVASPELAL
jgi:imidazolonepropionase-like amidohydrolase